MSALLYLVGIIFLLFGIGLSIALHELGHLLPAKLFGVRVSKYMIGFGPRLWSRTVGETEYGFRALPLGGYISMAGMYPTAANSRASRGMFRALIQDARTQNAASVLQEDKGRTFSELTVPKRIVIMLGGPLMNLIFAVVIFTVVLSGIGVQQASTTVASVSACVLPGQGADAQCGPQDPAGPAARAGFEPGDSIVAVQGIPVDDFSTVQEIIRNSPGKPLEFSVLRDGVQHSLKLVPQALERPVIAADGTAAMDDAGQPIMQTVGVAGFGVEWEFAPQPVTAGVEVVGARIGDVAGVIVSLPVKLWDVAVSLVTGGERDPNGPLSVVGVGRIAGEVAATPAPALDRVVVLLNLLGAVNIALFVFNLIPLLPLDGGHILIALWDGVRRVWAKLLGRPAPAPTDATAWVPLTIVVATILIAMGALLILADLFNPIALFG